MHAEIVVIRHVLPGAWDAIGPLVPATESWRRVVYVAHADRAGTNYPLEKYSQSSSRKGRRTGRKRICNPCVIARKEQGDFSAELELVREGQALTELDPLPE